MKENIRQCVACKIKKDRKLFIRILQEATTEKIIIEPHRKEFGRSIYVCKNIKCIEALNKHKKFKDKFNLEELKINIENDNWKQN